MYFFSILFYIAQIQKNREIKNMTRRQTINDWPMVATALNNAYLCQNHFKNE